MIVTRFAPSPTGHLHLGHAFSALFAWRAARDVGGRFLLRIEDIDPTRCRAQFTADLIEDLRWLGLRWPEPVWQQAARMPTYQAALERLRAMDLLYPCFCTRRDIAAAAHAPHAGDAAVYPRICRGLSSVEVEERVAAGLPFAWRLDMTRARQMTGPLSWRDRAAGLQTVQTDDLGDVVLARKETPTSYHLAVTVDDAAQEVTLVTRGVDLFRATDVQRVLQRLLELSEPDYHHHPLLTDATGRRLAKRDHDETLRQLRAQGVRPTEIWTRVGFPPES